MATHALKRRRNVRRSSNFERNNFQTDRVCSGFGLFHLQHWLNVSDVEDDSQSVQTGNNLPQKLYPLASEIGRLQ